VRPPAWLVDAVVAVYPKGVRDRYGPEIAGLIGDSPRPWRDLGDVAWNATLERTGSVRVGSLRPHVRQMLALVTFPAVFWFAMIVLTPVAFIGSGALGALVGHGHVRFTADNGIETGGGTGAFFTGAVLTVALLAVLASLNARRWIDSLAVPAPAFLVPTLLGLGCLGMTLVPPTLILVLEGERWVAVPAATACWWLMVLVLGARFRALTRQGRTAAARRLAVAGTPAVLAVTFTVHLATLAPHDAGLALFYVGPMSPPSLMAVCTPFTFAILAAVTPPVRT
jgi:hypothetical protein